MSKDPSGKDLSISQIVYDIFTITVKSGSVKIRTELESLHTYAVLASSFFDIYNVGNVIFSLRLLLTYILEIKRGVPIIYCIMYCLIYTCNYP